MTNFKHGCGGTWEPIDGWMGHYRCSVCCQVGVRYGSTKKARVVWEEYGHQCNEYMMIYRCSLKGCNSGAVRKMGKEWRCHWHSEKRNVA